MTEKKWCVYMHTNKINGKKYVGITSKEPHKRWGKNGIHYKSQLFYRAINKYGWDKFEHEILFTNLEEKEAKQKEIELIKKYKSKNRNFGYNLTDGGDGTVGIKISEETRTNLRTSHLGQIAWNKGMKGEYKVKTSHIHLEKWKSKTYRERQTASHLGNKQSEETKRKISENSTRLIPIYQLDKKTNIVINEFRSIKDAIKLLELKLTDSASISSCCTCRPKHKTACGYKWIYKEDYDNKTDRYYAILNSIDGRTT